MEEFTIQGTVCKVASEEEVGAMLERKYLASEHHIHVIGSCMLQGHRYFVLAETAEQHHSDNGDRSATDLLTRREMQVALMVSQGRCNKQIARQLHLSEWTVSSYIRRIYAKFGVRSRAAMVAKLLSSCTVERSPK